ncbi:hypothetical protein F4775DRAFT_566852 [Biscogniauxia sp. FL1348]|nr:hypothetical protein F4775DRAFT_566852 [Biscogniauxia sp. FL1348]
MPETCVPYNYIPPPTRQEIIDSCPGLGASPTQVRDWLMAYLLYRGLDSYKAEGFFWRGAELHRATLAILVEAFKKHCRIQDWEADILAHDVFAIVEVSAMPKKKKEKKRKEKKSNNYDTRIGELRSQRDPDRQ